MPRHGNAPRDRDLVRLFALFLAAIGLLLAYAPEFVYLRDHFGSRMNTVFKFYYQAWLLFAVSGSFAIILAYRHVRGQYGAPAVLGTLSLLLILGGSIFPVAAAYSKTSGFSSTQPTFDATAYVAQVSPDEAASIAWVRRHTAPGTQVLEAEGDSYVAATNRVSTITGRPTLLGWGGHQSQWRGDAYGSMAQGRGELLDLVYRSGTAEQIAQSLEAWGIDYVYVGPAERQRYEMTPRSEERLQQALALVFESGDVRIYGRAD
jgi:uncharacterized membrane protein